jgi:uncharacterized membrane protein YccC
MAIARPRPWLPSFPAKSWYHAISTVAAAMLAFYVSCALELDSPGSSMITVLIVSSPLPGMVLSKGIWRFVGTVVGVVISILLIAQFAQSPPAFVLALAVWLGLCTYVSSLLRYFRAYAAVLAGYTISLVALPAIDNPDQIFYLATARVAVVTVGIVCTALVKSLLILRVGQQRLKPALEGALTATARFAAQALNLEPGVPERRRLVAEQLNALDPLIVAAASESAVTAQQAPAVRLYVSILLNILTWASSVRDVLATLPEDGAIVTAITPLRNTVRDLLLSLCGTEAFLSPGIAEALAASRRTAAEMSAGLTSSAIAPESLGILALASRLEDILEQLTLARTYLIGIEAGRTGRKVTPVSYHRDAGAATINGLRGAIATIVAGSFWIATAWPQGPSMLAALLPVCTLLGTTDNPEAASMAFTRGIALGAVCALVCEYLMLAQIDGFPLLVVVVSPFLILGCLYSLTPKHAGSATAFLIFFTTLLNLRNPMQYDLAQSINTNLAFVLGSLCGVLAFRTLWPSNPIRAARGLAAQMRHDLGSLVGRRPPASLTMWETTMLDRLSRLGTRLANSPMRAPTIEGGLVAIHMGRGMVRARRILDGLALPADTARSVEAALRAMRGIATAPELVPEAVRTAAMRLLHTAEDTSTAADRSALLRAAAAFHEVDILFGRHQDFFTGAVPMEARTA